MTLLLNLEPNLFYNWNNNIKYKDLKKWLKI